MRGNKEKPIYIPPCLFLVSGDFVRIFLLAFPFFLAILCRVKQTFELLLTRIIRYFSRLDRIGRAWYIFLGYTLFLVITIFSYTVIQHEYYKKVADSQQKRIMQNPSSRGNILSSSESLGGVLAVSTNLGTLAIDPTQSGSRDKLLRFLSDLVFEEFCSHTKSECIEDISSYLRENLQDQKDLTEYIMKEKIRNYLSLKMDSPIESVDIASNLSEETIAIIESWQDPALFFVVNNLYVNPTKVQNASILAAQLSTLLSVPVEIINQKFAIKKRKHLEIIRKMSISVRDMVNKRMETELLAFKNKQINSTDMVSPFLKIEDNLIRYYPE